MTTRTKIVATVGPASRSPEILRQLVSAGVDVFRLNFSHGTHEEHTEVLRHIRTVARDLDRHVGVLQDLCGPKMRLEPLPGDIVDCRQDEEFVLVAGAATGARELACSYRRLPDDLRPAETVLFADGTVAMTVVDVEPGRARLKVTLPGRLRSRQGVNLPGSDLAVASLTDKDLRDLDWTADHADDVDFVGLSFVRRAEDVQALRGALETRGCPARVVVKIEKPQAVQNLEAIAAAADAVMVARGDLGVEMDVQRVPAIQKRVIALCVRTGRPVITATQMLASMEQSNRPTRAEASDVFNAVLDGTDAVMLSGETAVGAHPVDAVVTMRRICAEAEAWLAAGTDGVSAPAPGRFEGFDAVGDASVDAACLMAKQLGATLMMVASETGRTALALSSRRPAAPILALVRDDYLARSLALCRGVTPVVLTEETWAEHVLAIGMDWAREHGVVRDGQHAVLLHGHVGGRPDVRAVLAGTVSSRPSEVG